MLRKPAGRLGCSYDREHSELKGSGGISDEKDHETQTLGGVLGGPMSAFSGSCTVWQLSSIGV